jgi:hypothetical protein
MLILQTLYNGPKTNNINNNTSYNSVYDAVGGCRLGGPLRRSSRRPASGAELCCWAPGVEGASVARSVVVDPASTTSVSGKETTSGQKTGTGGIGLFAAGEEEATSAGGTRRWTSIK